MNTQNTLGKPDEEFRDRLATIDVSGKRLWVFARKPSGKLTTARNIVGFILIAFFVIAPFLKINGQPLLLLNFIDRVFVIFGVQFWPQDFHLFFLAMIALMVFIIVFTVTYGRLFCGWACPQTIFMELVFRKIEYWIEGTPAAQKKLANQDWDFEKAWKKSLKHLVFYVISFAIGNFFLIYIIGSVNWLHLVTDNPLNHIGGLSAMIIFSAIFYFIFSWFREQVCTIVCPYGRLQGVLLDRNSIVISYDYKRGENRGRIIKDEDRIAAGKGDCIDCQACVQVCPTGIDIRNGTQLECINCACCIDACNETMNRVGFRTGLIRYASEKTIAEGTELKFKARTIAYSAVLLILIAAFTYFLLSRNSIEATVLRSPGMLYQDQGNGKISNLYNIKLVNKTNADIPVTLKLLSPQGEIKLVGEKLTVKAESIGESVFFVIIDKSLITGEKLPVIVGIYSNGKEVDRTKATFVGPNIQ
jgi:cytochrome c oxidase accessory protein FixG